MLLNEKKLISRKEPNLIVGTPYQKKKEEKSDIKVLKVKWAHAVHYVSSTWNTHLVLINRETKMNERQHNMSLKFKLNIEMNHVSFSYSSIIVTNRTNHFRAILMANMGCLLFIVRLFYPKEFGGPEYWTSGLWTGIAACTNKKRFVRKTKMLKILHGAANNRTATPHPVSCIGFQIRFRSMHNKKETGTHTFLIYIYICI